MAYESAEYETILVERRDRVAIVTLNRPDRLNAINMTLRGEVERAVGAAREDDDIRALIITGAGRGFCAGADLQGPAARDRDAPAPAPSQNQRLDQYSWVGAWARLFHDFDKPLIGAINGVAAGAGMSMSLGCDVRIGSELARFKTVFVERNLSPDSGMSYFLPRIVGYARAADLIMTSRSVEAEEAHRIGLLNRMARSETLLDEAVAFAEEMTRWPPLAVRSAKRVLQNNFEVSLDQALRYEITGINFASRAPNDARESRLSFVEKRKGVYTGT
jgi:2-(1,2-epoxy-1,2-dihydrophenyl)acetyl-CoA isomerase